MKSHVLSLLVVVACSDLGPSSSPLAVVAEARSPLPCATANLADAKLEAYVQGNTAFAIDMFRAISKPDENLVFSPYSVSTVLNMALAGAASTTESELATVLHQSSGQDVHEAANALELRYAAMGAEVEMGGGTPFQLQTANRPFVQRDLTLEQPYLDLLALYYGAGAKLVDFRANPGGARSLINGWVADQTADHIPQLLGEGAVDVQTRLVLVNAVYFNAGFSSKFDKNATYTQSFKAPGGSVDVPMMHQAENFLYAERDGTQAVSLAFRGGGLSMVVIKPQDLATFEASMTPEILAELAQGSGRRVNLALPRFKIDPRTSTSLKPALSKLGAPHLFQGADFSRMTKEPLQVSDVLHSATINVNEIGVEATAATAVVFQDGGAKPAPDISITFDQPFVYGIFDDKTRTWLFLGHMLNPAK